MREVPLLPLVELVLLLAAFVFTIATAWRVAKGGGSAAVSELSEANRVLEKRVHELGAEVRDLRVENAELRARTDYQAVINEHERRAADRHDRTLGVLELIAQRLGPEPTAATA